jgi:flagellar protein FlbD
MIRLTRLNQQPLVLNADLIVSVESTPDTLVTLMNGDRIHVREAVEEVVDRAVDYHRRCAPQIGPRDAEAT